VPGAAGLNTGGYGFVRSLSCASPGNCSAGGDYKDSSDHEQAFVASQHNGRWGRAEEVPGTAALNLGTWAEINAVSCRAPGDCSAGGSYANAAEDTEAFVVTETHWRWGRASEVPGTAALAVGDYAAVDAIGCSAAGNCTAVGTYKTSSVAYRAFAVADRNGRWGRAAPIPGVAALDVGGFVSSLVLSCAGPGDCTAGGIYTAAGGRYEAFVAAESSGRWRSAGEVPGTAALNAGGSGGVTSVACPAAGACAVAGYYKDRSGATQVFVAQQVRGRWGRAREIPGTGRLNAGGADGVDVVACAAAGNCAVGGTYSAVRGAKPPRYQAYLAAEVRGRWHAAVQVAGAAALNPGDGGGVVTMSCPAAGACTAAGYVTSRSGRTSVFVAAERDGRWSRAAALPQAGPIDAGGGASVNSISCRLIGHCSAGGEFLDQAKQFEPFVVTEG
jgi:hypothetical protein